MPFEFLLECLHIWIVEGDEHADTPDAVRFLGTCHGWARCRTESYQELAPPHVRPPKAEQ